MLANRYPAFSLFVVGVMCMLCGCESTLQRQIDYYDRVRDDDSARATLERAVSEDPANAEAHFLLGRLLLQRQEYVEGRRALDASRNLSPRYAEQIEFLLAKDLNVHFEAGTHALAEEDYSRAITHLRFTTEISPEDKQTFLALGQAFARSGANSEAETAYTNVLSLDPEDFEALNNLTELMLRRNAFGEAIHYARRRISLEAEGTPQRDYVRALHRLSYSAMRTGNYAEAEDTFNELNALRSANDRVIQEYAVLNFNSRRYRVALPHLLQLSNSHHDTTGTYLRLLGEAYFGLEDYWPMAETYARMVRRFPNDRDARMSLIFANEMLGYFTAADSLRAVLRTGANQRWQEQND